MQSAGILSERTHLYIVCTKYDKIKKSEKKDSTMEFLERKYKNLEETFASRVGKMNLVYLCAYGIKEKEEKIKMEGLLTGFTQEREHNDLNLFEKPIVKRQMDKFVLRG